MVREKVFSRKLCARLAELSRGEAGTEPFLIVRGLYPTKFWLWQYPAKFIDDYDPETDPSDDKVMTVRAWFIENFIYDIVSSGLIAQLNAEHKKKDVNDKRIHRNYFTSFHSAVDQFTNDADLPLRFRSAVPEFRFEDDPHATNRSLTARYALYVCVENPLCDPIWVLSADHVAAALLPADKSLLAADRYLLFDNWHPDLRGRFKPEVQRIMEPRRSNTGEVARISFDANRIQIDHPETHVEGRAAVARLREKMQEAGAEHAVPAFLRRGDVLIVDNYRALVRRAHNRYAPYFWWWKPPRRWLRLYCGFPFNPTGHIAKPDLARVSTPPLPGVESPDGVRTNDELGIGDLTIRASTSGGETAEK